jgi:hypothetical protein
MSAPGQSPHQPLPPATATLVVILLAVPILAILIVPIYARSGPVVDGWPFFYWYQVVWVPVSAVFTGSAYLVVRRARANQGGARANQDGGRR